MISPLLCSNSSAESFPIVKYSPSLTISSGPSSPANAKLLVPLANAFPFERFFLFLPFGSDVTPTLTLPSCFKMSDSELARRATVLTPSTFALTLTSTFLKLFKVSSNDSAFFFCALSTEQDTTYSKFSLVLSFKISTKLRDPSLSLILSTLSSRDFPSYQQDQF